MADPFISYRGTVYPWQMDHMGHMNVMWYVNKFDEATWNLFAEIGMTPAYFAAGDFGMAAVRQNIVYRREVMAGDILTIHSGIVEARPRLLRFVHRMSAGADEAAACEITAVHIDRHSRKAAPFPEAVHGRATEMLTSLSLE